MLWPPSCGRSGPKEPTDASGSPSGESLLAVASSSFLGGGSGLCGGGGGGGGGGGRTTFLLPGQGAQITGTSHQLLTAPLFACCLLACFSTCLLPLPALGAWPRACIFNWAIWNLIRANIARNGQGGGGFWQLGVFATTSFAYGGFLGSGGFWQFAAEA